MEIRSEVIIICEGLADVNFFEALVQERTGLPPIDILRDKEGGISSFAKKLQGIRGDGHAFSKLKGVLLVADSADNPGSTFSNVCKQIRSATGYAIPTRPDELSAQVVGYPQLLVMLIPNDHEPGSLESLCNLALEEKNEHIAQCVDSFLSCETISAHQWSPEKIAKARFHSMIAALNEDDPSRAMSYVFQGRKRVISVEHHCFDDVYNRLLDFCQSVGAIR